MSSPIVPPSSPTPKDEALVVFNMYRVIGPDGEEIHLPRPLTCVCGLNHERLVLEPVENKTGIEGAYTYQYACPVTGRTRVVGFKGST